MMTSKGWFSQAGQLGGGILKTSLNTSKPNLCLSWWQAKVDPSKISLKKQIIGCTDWSDKYTKINIFSYILHPYKINFSGNGLDFDHISSTFGFYDVTINLCASRYDERRTSQRAGATFYCYCLVNTLILDFYRLSFICTIFKENAKIKIR